MKKMTVNPFLKKVIKFVLPYGMLLLYRYLKAAMSRLKHRKENLRERKIIGEKVKNVKVVHLLTDSKFAASYVDFINSEFEQKEHVFLFKKSKKRSLSSPLPKGKNVYILSSFLNMPGEQLEGKKVLCHGLFNPKIIHFFAKNRFLLHNSIWFIYGGDIYDSLDDKKSSIVKRSFEKYLILAPEEKDFFIQKYGQVKGDFIYMKNWKPSIKERYDKAKYGIIPKDYILIQINNSASEETLEMLEILSKFRNEKIKIRTIVSYGKFEFKDRIIALGQELFGDTFEYLDEFLEKEEYQRMLSQVDILVMNQNRQQGLGNIRQALYFGAKVFIKNNVSTFKSLSEDFCIYDSNMIKDMDFASFVANPTREQNIKSTSYFFDRQPIVEMWKKIFELDEPALKLE